MIYCLYCFVVLLFLFSVKLWHKEEEERLYNVFNEICLSFDVSGLIGLANALDWMLIYGMDSAEAKKAIIENKIPGFYLYE